MRPIQDKTKFFLPFEKKIGEFFGLHLDIGVKSYWWWSEPDVD